MPAAGKPSNIFTIMTVKLLSYYLRNLFVVSYINWTTYLTLKLNQGITINIADKSPTHSIILSQSLALL